MESPEHRDNILNPKYDRVGIGVVYSEDRKYYVTQDFCQELQKFQPDEAEGRIKSEIAKIRQDNGLPPLAYHNIANSYARRHAWNRAAGKPLQDLAGLFGEIHIHFIKTPDLTLPRNISREVIGERYETSAVGAWFGRLPDYPGGTYLITIFLFPISPYGGMTEEELSKIALEAMNTKRKESGLSPIKLDRRQSKNASGISQGLKKKQAVWHLFKERQADRQVLSYETEDPRVWPLSLDSIITDRRLRRIGIGISSKKNAESQRQTFLVTLII
jgi:uncharacterized protein YkwD